MQHANCHAQFILLGLNTPNNIYNYKINIKLHQNDTLAL
jgi:hypothetical protein